MIRPQSGRLRVLDCEVDTLRRCVTRDDAEGEWRLTPKALQVLLVLVQSQDEVVTREALFQRVWPHTMPTDDVLTQAVTQLRKAFGDDCDAPRYIETIARTGYRLLAPACWLDAAAAGAAGDGAGDAAGEVAMDAPDAAGSRDHGALPRPVSAPAGPAPVPASPGRRRAVIGVIVAGVVLALAIAVAALRIPPATGPAFAVDEAHAGADALQLDYRAIASTPGRERLPSLSPDGRTVAYVHSGEDGGSALMLQDVSRTAARALTTPAAGTSDTMPVWSRDGTRIAFVRVSDQGCRFMLVAASGGEPREAGPCLDGAWSHFDWTPDGRGLVAGGPGRPGEAGAPLQRLDLATGRWQALDYAIGAGDVDQQPRYSPDGRWLAFRRNISLADLWIMPADGGTPRPITRLRRDIRGWDWLPDSSGLVLSQVAGNATLWLLRLADGSLRPLSRLPSGNAVHPDIAADHWSMVLEIDHSRSGLFRARIDGGAGPAPEPVFASSGVDMLPALSPDGQALAFLSDRSMSIQLWLGEVGQPATLRAVEGLQPLPRHPPVWSADGRRLLVLGRTEEGERLFEVEVATGRPQALAVPAARPVFATYTGDPGRLLVGIDDGNGRVRAVLYRRADWQVLAAEDDVALARYDPGADALLFSRSSVPGLWRSDAALGDIVQVSGVLPTPSHYRHWALLDGRAYSIAPEGDCATPWRPLSGGADGPCISRKGGAVGGSPTVDGRWLYLGLPVSQNVDIGWARLPRPASGPAARTPLAAGRWRKSSPAAPGMTFGCATAQCRFDFVPLS